MVVPVYRAIGRRRMPRPGKLIRLNFPKAARAYLWKTSYRVFPGPNSNTFSGWIARQVPELELDLPLSAMRSGCQYSV